MTVKYQLKCRLPWFKYAKREIVLNGNTKEEIIREALKYSLEYCPEITFNQGLNKFRANNQGHIEITYSMTISEKVVRKNANSLLAFISLCTGIVCQYENWIIIDDNTIPNFFDFPEETKRDYLTLKDVKFWEISFEDVKEHFSRILDFLFFSDEDPIILHVLPNYLATIYDIDFLGNLEWKFQNSVTTIECLMNLINKDSYHEKETLRHKLLEELKTSLTKKHFRALTIRRIPLEEKIKDAIELGEKILGVSIVRSFNKQKFANKCANTRNHFCHYLEFNADKDYLSLEEISDATSFLNELSRIILFSQICQAIDIPALFRNKQTSRLLLKFYDFRG